MSSAIIAAGALLTFASLAHAGVATPAPDPGPEATSLLEAFFIQRHADGSLELLGSLIIWVLLALSAMCVGLIGAMALQNTRNRIFPSETAQAARRLLADRDHDNALMLLRTKPSYFSSVLAAALEEAGAGYSAMVRAAEQASEQHTVARLRRVELLNVVGNVSPMIGLFGTVYGMILAFREIVASGGTPDPVSLAAGIGTALTTTFWGLIVAIPALAGYALLRNRIDGLTVEASRHAEELINEFRPAAASAHQQRTRGGEGGP